MDPRYSMRVADVAAVLGLSGCGVRNLDAKLRPVRTSSGARAYDPRIVWAVAEERRRKPTRRPRYVDRRRRVDARPRLDATVYTRARAASERTSVSINRLLETAVNTYLDLLERTEAA